MKIPPSFRWKPTGRTLGQGGQATVVEVTDSTGQHSGRFALKGLATGGFGNLKDFQGSHMVFGNPIPNGISAGKCNYCGFCFAHGTDAVQVEMTHRKGLS